MLTQASSDFAAHHSWKENVSGVDCLICYILSKSHAQTINYSAFLNSTSSRNSFNDALVIIQLVGP